jgi:AcrR family transcriptional regulator
MTALQVRSTESSTSAGRRVELLDAAAQVFLRYGYKKTTMDEVARAAGLSRPGLYLHFPAKELIFRAAVAHLLERALSAAREALRNVKRPLDVRIVEGFVAVHGHTIGRGVSAEHLAELIDSANVFAKEDVDRYEQGFRDELIGAIKSGTAKPRSAAPGMTPTELADLLTLISYGLKHRAPTLAEYRDRLREAVRLLCRSEHR